MSPEARIPPMKSLAPWYTELRRLGTAPDHCCELRFSRPVRARLRALLDSLEPRVFRRHEDLAHGEDLYLREVEFSEYVRARHGQGTVHHFPSLHLLTVSDRTLSIFRGNGGSSLAEVVDFETRLFEALLGDEQLPLCSWRIEDRGDGCPGSVRREGHSKATMSSYLHSLV